MKSFTLKKSPPPTPSRGSISHSHSFELWILSTLQGSSASYEEKQRISQDLELLTDAEKDELIEFIQAEVIIQPFLFCLIYIFPARNLSLF